MGSFITASMRSVVRDEVRRDVALVELHALDGVDGNVERLGILDGDDAVLAHDFHGSGDLFADLGSPAEMVPTEANLLLGLDRLACFFISATAALTALSMPRRMASGLTPAATLRRPSLTIAWASRVAVVVPSPTVSLVLVATSFTSWAPMFSMLSSSSILLGDGNAVVGDGRGTERALQSDVAALWGPW